MAEVRYKTIEINAPGGAHLREYAYSPDKGYDVKTEEMIGNQMANGTKVNVVYPITYSEDKKWVQVFNEQGLTGFIAASHIDEKKVELAAEETLDKPFIYFFSEEDRIVYETANGFRKFDSKVVTDAINKRERRKQILGNEEVQECFDSILKEKGFSGLNGTSTEDLLRIGSDEIHFYCMDHFSSDNSKIKEMKNMLNIYGDYQRNMRYFESLVKSGIPASLDRNTGRVCTAASVRDMLTYKNNLDSQVAIGYAFSSKHDGFMKDEEDKKNFAAGNRCYAERLAEERLEYKRKKENDLKEQSSFDIPVALQNVEEKKNIEDMLETIGNDQRKIGSIKETLANKQKEVENLQKQKKVQEQNKISKEDITKTEEQLKQEETKLEELKSASKKKIDDIREELTQPYTELFRNQVLSHGGFLIAEVHTDRRTRDWIADNIGSMKEAGINTIYIEHLFSGNDQKLVDEFLKGTQKEMCPALKNLCSNGTFLGMEELLIQAKEKGVRVVGIGSSLSQAKNSCLRAHLLNQDAANLIKQEQEKEPGGYVVLAGAAHLMMHVGMEQSVPVPGLSQLLGMHTFEMDSESKITIKDPDLIYDKDKELAKSIPSYREQLMKEQEANIERDSNMSQTLDDFVNFYTGSNRILGNSEQFERIKQLAQELQQLDQTPISHDMMYDRGQKLQELIGATSEYVNKHADPDTRTGKERKETTDAFMKFCIEEKKYTDLEANSKYFEGKTLKDMKNGITFKDMNELEAQLETIKRLPMTEENVIKYANLANKTMQAAEIYLTFTKPGLAQTPSERKRAEQLLNTHQLCNSSIRDLRTVRGLIAEGKSWDDLLALREASIELTGKQEKVGANVSQRLKITHNGKTGFFTEQTFATPFEETIDRYVAENQSTKEQRLIGDNRSLLRNLDHAPQNASEHDARKMEVFKLWDQMPDAKAKKNLQSVILAAKGIDSLENVWVRYNNAINKLSEAERKDPARLQQALKTVVNEHEDLKPKDRKLYMEHSDMLIDLMGRAPEANARGTAPARMALEVALYTDMLKQDTKTKEGMAAYQARRDLIDNPKAMTEAVGLWKSATGVQVGLSNAKFDKKDNAELTSRNVATSRMAELLGVGNLIAHSEKMTVKIDGKEVTGCFMEFAEGMDAATKDINQLRAASQTTLDMTGTVARDGSNLKLFDLICGQVDRHAGNLFTSVGELGEDGKRSITGIMGIDNDLAFSRKTDQDKHNRSGDLDLQIFVDAEFAKKVNSLTRESLDYALGDLLSPEEIDAAMTRVNRVKDHISKEAIVLSGDEWKLDAYSIDADVKTLDAKGKKYVDGLKQLKKSTESDLVWDIEKHDEAKAIRNIRGASKRYSEAMKEEDELYGDMRFMFDKAEAEAELKDEVKELDTEKFMPKKKSPEEMRAKRAAMFDKIVADKKAEKEAPAKEEPTKSTPTQNVRQPEKVSVRELSAFDKSRDKGARFGMKPAEKKEKDLGFTEISKEDIKEANKNVKKPIIGAHRAKK